MSHRNTIFRNCYLKREFASQKNRRKRSDFIAILKMLSFPLRLSLILEKGFAQLLYEIKTSLLASQICEASQTHFLWETLQNLASFASYVAMRCLRG